jgi:hypothetical protein
LGSAREVRGWYFDGRHVLGGDVAQHRIRLCTEIIRLLLTMIPQQRSYAVHEEVSEYEFNSNQNYLDQGDGIEQMSDLLRKVPLPED